MVLLFRGRVVRGENSVENISRIPPSADKKHPTQAAGIGDAPEVQQKQLCGGHSHSTVMFSYVQPCFDAAG